MTHWQVDFYRRPLSDEAGRSLWELVICDVATGKTAIAFCPQSEANAAWLTEQLQKHITSTGIRPDTIQAFRPQSAHLLSTACENLKIKLVATRHTPQLKEILQYRADDYRSLPNYTNQPYDPLNLEQPPPVPLPEALWGDRWRFASTTASDLEAFWSDRPIPICSLPDALLPVNLQLPSNAAIPGVVIDGGRQSMQFARWIADAEPAFLSYIPGSPDGLILDAGLVDRWVLTTFEDDQVIAAAKTFRDRQSAAKGLHFLLIQPDDSGMTYSGFWLLRSP